MDSSQSPKARPALKQADPRQRGTDRRGRRFRFGNQPAPLQAGSKVRLLRKASPDEPRPRSAPALRQWTTWQEKPTCEQGRSSLHHQAPCSRSPIASLRALGPRHNAHRPGPTSGGLSTLTLRTDSVHLGRSADHGGRSCVAENRPGLTSSPPPASSPPREPQLPRKAMSDPVPP